jgi:hypothetical protein
MKKIYIKVDSFIKREWFLLVTVGSIAIAIMLFELL